MADIGPNFGKLVRRYREAQGLSAKELALAAFGDEAKRSRISELENGKVKSPQAKTISALQVYLNIPQEEVDACRLDLPLPSAPPAAPMPEQTAAPDLPRELLENLAQRFGVENPDAPAGELTAFLKDKAREWQALKARIEGLEEVDARLANQRAAAEDAVAKGDFAEADAILEGAEDIQISERALTEAVKVAEIRETRGDIALFDGRVEDAVAMYESAIGFVAPFDPVTAAHRRNDLAVKLFEHGERFASAGLVHAAAFLATSLQSLSRETMPADWATTQMNRAVALRKLGERAGGEEGLRFLKEAVEAYDAALEIHTRETMPAQWATTQMNLAGALITLGERAGGEEGVRFLREAVEAYDTALEIRTRETMPADWARTQMNRAVALFSLGRRAGGEEGLGFLKEAVEACDLVLEVFSRETMPADWAMTQGNRANALSSLGERAGGEEGLRFLKEAVEAYDAALEVCTRETMPAQWAMTQGNRANVLSSLGERAGGEEGLGFLKGAVEAYDATLEVVTRETMPANWAMTQMNRQSRFAISASGPAARKASAS